MAKKLRNGAVIKRLRLTDPNVKPHPEAQRKLDNRWVAKIEADFDPLLCDPVKINYDSATGTYWIWDHQHNWSALKRLALQGKIENWFDGMVWTDLSEAEVHRGFVGHNAKVKKMSGLPLWRSMLKGKDRDMVGLIKCIEQHGFTAVISIKNPDQTASKHHNYDWWKQLGELLTRYRECDKTFGRMMVAMNSWRHELTDRLRDGAKNCEIIRAVFHFIQKYGAEFSDDVLQDLFARTTPERVRELATNMQSSSGNCRADQFYLMALINAMRVKGVIDDINRRNHRLSKAA